MKKSKTAKKFMSFAIAFALVLMLFNFALVSVSASSDAYSTISARFSQTFVVKNDGSLWAWGRNDYGSLGDGTESTRPTPTKIMDEVIQVSAGQRYTMAIKSNGSLWAWGQNWYGQLGDGTTEDKYTPIKIMDEVVQVSAGDYYTMAIKNDGSLWAWGLNELGGIGDGTTEERHIPIKIMDEVIQVSVGHSHTVAIKSDGSLWAWGGNLQGQLGNGTTTKFNQANPIPIKIMDEVVQVSAGDYYTMAIKNDGSLWAWGSNGLGWIGDGTIDDYKHEFKLRTTNGDILTNELSIIFIELSKMKKIMDKPIEEMTSLEMWSIFFECAHDPRYRKIVNKIIEAKE